MYEYNAEILRVVDADTVDLKIFLGFTVSTEQRVRLEGLNAAEKNTPLGKEAMLWLRQRLPVGTKVIVRSKKPGAGDKYGRYLAQIIDVESSINDELLASGYALPWDGQGVKPV